jgi:hypothetical protein
MALTEQADINKALGLSPGDRTDDTSQRIYWPYEPLVEY